MKAILCIAALLLPHLILVAQSDEVIQDIRNKYKIIEESIKQNKYTIDTLELECSEEEKFYIDYYMLKYFDNGNLRKIDFNLSANQGGTSYEFYVWSDTLFFVFTKSQSIRTLSEVEEEYHFTEERYYYHKNLPVRCLVKNYKDVQREMNYFKNVDKGRNEEVPCNKAGEVQEIYRKLTQNTLDCFMD